MASRPPGVSAPLAIISPTNQSGLIIIITALSMCFVLVSCAIRIYVRFTNGPWRWDDHALTAATILACTQSALVFFEVRGGLGQLDPRIDQPERTESQRAYFANNILYILTLFFTKASIAFLYLRLTPSNSHLRVVWSILAVSVLWTAMSILLLTIDCSWHSTCPNSLTRWLPIGIVDAVVDVALVLMSIYLVYQVRLTLRQKATVVGAFGCRLLIIPACVVRLYYLNTSTLASNRTLAISLVVVCTQLQIGCGVMAASVPCLKPFMAVYEEPTSAHTIISHNVHSRFPAHSNSSGRKRPLKLESLNSALRHKSNISPTEPSPTKSSIPPLRPDVPQHSYKATVSYHDKKNDVVDEENLSVQSHDSQRMIIERKVDWSVQSSSASLKHESSEASAHAS